MSISIFLTSFVLWYLAPSIIKIVIFNHSFSSSSKVNSNLFIISQVVLEFEFPIKNPSNFLPKLSTAATRVILGLIIFYLILWFHLSCSIHSFHNWTNTRKFRPSLLYASLEQSYSEIFLKIYIFFALYISNLFIKWTIGKSLLKIMNFFKNALDLVLFKDIS